MRLKTWLKAVLFGSSMVSLVCILMATSPPVAVSAKIDAAAALQLTNPDEVCAGCHRDIYERYRSTPMARGSGLAADGVLQGGFVHAASGVAYRVFMRDGRVWMSYERTASEAAIDTRGALQGEEELRYFVGSGHRGRTYLYAIEGEWFEAPINYYSKKKLWDMAPNYGTSRTMPDALPVDSNCLHCHATDVQAALAGVRNKYAGAPFGQGGIGCSACHGNPAEHLRTQGRGGIVNPDKLTAVKRDSVCLQCHLEGDAAVYRAGTSLADFRAGQDLADKVAYYVRRNEEAGGGRATSQYEALLRSRCKIASGDKLTCTTCHDAHSSPSEEERVSYFRGKCLSCHTGPQMATAHHPEQRDCAVCHMPTRASTDISHEQTTDHDIQRHPLNSPLRLMDVSARAELVPVGRMGGGPRELGLAYAQLAEHGDRSAAMDALRLLQEAENAGADDAELHTQLGLIEQVSGDLAHARAEYLMALAEDAEDATAEGDLAVLQASSGRTKEAVDLLGRILSVDPSQTAAGLNLAFIECSVGDKKKANEILEEISRFNPDDPAVRRFRRLGLYAGQRCNLSQTEGLLRDR